MANPEDDQPRGAERRKTSREDLTVRVEYATVDELFSDFARNINAGGIFVTHPQGQAPCGLGQGVRMIRRCHLGQGFQPFERLAQIAV